MVKDLVGSHQSEIDLMQGGNVHLFENEEEVEAVKWELKGAERGS
jgi:hypothetical protein